jgi:cell division protein FtsI (penicillin-binding protein 3)
MSPKLDAGVLLGRRRLRLLALALSAALLGLGLRVIDLALLSGEDVIGGTAIAGSMGEARRADILDRNGVLLATDYPKTSVYADPKLVLDAESAANRLAPVLGIDRRQLLARLSRPGRFVWLKRHISAAEERSLFQLGLPGIAFRTELHRVYPQRHLASHLIGFVGIDNQGLAGVERSFEDRLTGSATTPPPLVLTLDIGVQEAVRSELSAAVERFRAKGGTGLVLNAGSGELLAIVSLPDFDPNHYQSAPPEARFNRNTQGTYELGSLFKVFTAAMALDAGSTGMDIAYDATEQLAFGRHRINDFHAHRRWLSVPEVIAFSSNIGAARMATELGVEGQKAYLERFGLLDRHPIRLPEVEDPQAPSPWRPINTVTAAYGHGIAVSPLQTADAFGRVLCSAPRSPAHLVPEDLPPAEGPVVSAETAAKLRWLMWLTVAEGTGDQAAVPGYLVGGKTGSADKAGARGYRQNAILSSFIAAFPIDQPRYVVLVTLDEPKGDAATFGFAHGGWTAAPTVGRIIGRIGPLLGLPPDGALAEPWLRAALIEGQALNGRTRRIEKSFAAAADVQWLEQPWGNAACGCLACSPLG